MENEKGRSYSGSNRSIRNSNKTLWQMDREVRLGIDDWRITETMFTWIEQNNTESTGYEIRKKELQYLTQATISNTTGGCSVEYLVENKRNNNINNTNTSLCQGAVMASLLGSNKVISAH